MKITISWILFITIVLFICFQSVLCKREVYHMMYETFDKPSMCFRVFNGTNQFGCSTPPSGVTGVVHFLKKEEDASWLLEHAIAGPYIIVIYPTLFNKDIMYKLQESPKVSGVVLAATEGPRPDNMSPDGFCPNQYSSLPGSCNDTKPWNPWGSGFSQTDWKIPLFAIKDSDVIKQIEDCYTKFNLPLDDSQTERVLCSLKMTSHMFGAVDTPTCLRRNSYGSSLTSIWFCDPLGDQNLVSFVNPHKEDVGVIMVTARMDSGNMFNGMSGGAVTTVSGIVTLLTTAHLLSQLLPKENNYTKNVVFILLNGEAEDYIGSSRVVFDMNRTRFPSYETPLTFENVDQIIDIHQLDGASNIYCHCYESAVSQNTVRLFSEASKNFSINVEGSCSKDARLPPSSLHSFLKSNISIPGIILTNHGDQYNNKFYNSLLDDAQNINYKYANGSKIPEKSVQHKLASVSHALAQTLARLVGSGGNIPKGMTIENTSSLVDELLHCYLESRQCKQFSKVGGRTVVGDDDGPLSLYVSVNRESNQITSVTYLTMASLTGTNVNYTEEQCNNMQSKQDNYSYVWILGGENEPGYCVQTSLFYTPAVSPAFLIENYDWTSGEFPTWTESVWQDSSLRMYVRAPFTQQLYTLILGIFITCLSFLIVNWISRNADHLFKRVADDRC